MKNDKTELEQATKNERDTMTSVDIKATDFQKDIRNKALSSYDNKSIDISLDSTIKQRLIIYAVLSGISYAYLILVPFLGLGMSVFAIIQLALVLYLIKGRAEVKNKKAILVFIPVFILTLCSFVRDNNMFHTANFAVIFLLYSTMILLFMNDLGLENRGILFINKIICTVFKPLLYFNVPLKWSMESKKNTPNRILLRKILIGIAVSIPCLIIITFLLMNADLVFESKIDLMFNSIENLLGPQAILKIIIGTLAGFYLFGLFFIVFKKKKENNLEVSNSAIKDGNNLDISTIKKAISKPQGDVVIISVMLISILAIYTMFAIIQFKYLFAGASLPADLSYAQYARRGFFELLFLSFINIGLILAIIYLVRDKIYNNSNSSNSSKLIKILMLYLCAITIMLLVSSFYRMALYNNEYGFTELRILVVIFLIFEAVGLLVTFYYIIKPKFNIIAFYSVVCLIFYLTVNVINLDYIIAKENIDMHYEGKDLDVHYLYRLSADAAPQMKRLLDDKDIFIQRMAQDYFEKIDYQATYTKDWRSFNLSRNNALKIINELNLVFLKD